MTTTPTVETAFAVGNQLGEGPLWDHRVEELVWVDIAAGELWSGAPGEAPRILTTVEGALATVALGPNSTYLLAIDRSLVRFDPHAHEVTVLERLGADGTRLNDGAVDAAGRWWIGSMGLDHGPGKGSLYRLTVDGHTDVLSSIGISNGIDWSSDGTRMYFTDTLTRRIDVFDYDLATGTASDRRPFATIEDAAGYPDGLIVDDDNRVWVALWDGGAIRCYDRTGALVHDLELPVSRPTSCAFGGSGMTTLFVTSASGPDVTHEPSAGNVFGINDLGRGRPSPEASIGQHSVSADG